MAKRKWKKVQVVEGWLGHEETRPLFKWWTHGYTGNITSLDTSEAFAVSKIKGKKCIWGSGSWPPKRVRITVEVEE